MIIQYLYSHFLIKTPCQSINRAQDSRTQSIVPLFNIFRTIRMYMNMTCMILGYFFFFTHKSQAASINHEHECILEILSCPSTNTDLVSTFNLVIWVNLSKVGHKNDSSNTLPTKQLEKHNNRKILGSVSIHNTNHGVQLVQ